MARSMIQFRDPDLSAWQSAVDETVAKATGQAHALSVGGPAAASRPDQDDPMIAAANDLSSVIADTQIVPDVPSASLVAQGIEDTAKFCSTTAFKLAKAKLLGNKPEAVRLVEELTVAMGPCDPKWLTVVGTYFKNKATGTPIPYRRFQSIGDFVVNDIVGTTATIALVADWGTGDDAAKLLLRQIAQKNPDLVIHLGDVYYSGTQYEFQNYFYNIWQETFGIPKANWGDKVAGPTKPATYTLAGNHDMYSGGQPYYTTLDMLGQPASYFCLRNDDWQFIGIDTGLHDSNPVMQSATFLEDQEVAWLKDKIATAGSRKTVLLSHHQLFTSFESIGTPGSKVNPRLAEQLQDILPGVTVWFWGHEHNLVIYDKYQGVMGRCIGHGAFPVDVDQLETPAPDVPVIKVALSPEDDGATFQHGYVLLELAGATAKVTYFQFDAETQTETVLHTEAIGADGTILQAELTEGAGGG